MSAFVGSSEAKENSFRDAYPHLRRSPTAVRSPLRGWAATMSLCVVNRNFAAVDLNAHAFASAAPMITSLTESESHRLGGWFFSQCWEVFQYSNHQLSMRSHQRRAIYDQRNPSQGATRNRSRYYSMTRPSCAAFATASVRLSASSFASIAAT